LNAKIPVCYRTALIAAVGVDVVLELSDQKTRGFLVHIVFNRLFPEHVRKVFGKMLVST
jgi:hypothetical protein